jgi:hypothetical protein
MWGLAAVLVIGAGCGSDDPNGSTTPRITAGPDGTGPTNAFVTASELEPLELGVLQTSDLSEIPVYENPDPRGPCGATSPEPPLTSPDATARVFAAQTAVVVQFVQPVTMATDEFHNAARRDLRPDCDPYASTTNQGLRQRVDQINAVATEDPDVVAFTSRVNVGSEQQIFMGAISAVGEDWYSLIQVQSAEPIDADAMAQLAASAADRIAGP